MERDRAIADLVKEKEKMLKQLMAEHNKKLNTEKQAWKKDLKHQLDEKDKELLEFKTTGRSDRGAASESMYSSRDAAISSEISGLMNSLGRSVEDETLGKTARSKEEEVTSRRDSSIQNEMSCLMASMGR